MRATLTIDLDAIVANWRALDRLSGPATATAAVVKADAYGLGAAQVAPALAAAGCTRFFVALAEEGAALRQILGPGPQIFVLNGYAGEPDFDASLIPCLNSLDQARAWASRGPLAVQLDTGMNRLGVEPADLPALLPLLGRVPALVLSHLGCADTPGHAMNATQLAAFLTMAPAFPGAVLSLAATGGILLGPAYHFGLTRPGIGLFGGRPFRPAQPVVRLDLPVIQTRTVLPGEPVGYGATWRAQARRRIATVAAGYADGLLRALGNSGALWSGGTRCPIVGRLSMDLITADVTDCADPPATLQALGPNQTVDALGEAAGTIGYEVLTALGHRYARRHIGGGG